MMRKRLLSVLLCLVLLCGLLPAAAQPAAAAQSYTAPDLRGNPVEDEQWFIRYAKDDEHVTVTKGTMSGSTKVTITGSNYSYYDKSYHEHKAVILTATSLWRNSETDPGSLSGAYDSTKCFVEVKTEEQLEVYLVDFGTQVTHYAENLGKDVTGPTKKLSQIKVLGDNVSVYLVNSSLSSGANLSVGPNPDAAPNVFGIPRLNSHI